MDEGPLPCSGGRSLSPRALRRSCPPHRGQRAQRSPSVPQTAAQHLGAASSSTLQDFKFPRSLQILHSAGTRSPQVLSSSLGYRWRALSSLTPVGKTAVDGSRVLRPKKYPKSQSAKMAKIAKDRMGAIPPQKFPSGGTGPEGAQRPPKTAGQHLANTCLGRGATKPSSTTPGAPPALAPVAPGAKVVFFGKETGDSSMVVSPSGVSELSALHRYRRVLAGTWEHG